MFQRVARLHRAGLKATGPRLVILAALEQDHTHPTAEQLYDTLRRDHPSLSLSTVYQTLDAFLRTGCVAGGVAQGSVCASTGRRRTRTMRCGAGVGRLLMYTGIRRSARARQGTGRMVGW